MSKITKHIKPQISSDADAMYETIKLLHRLNFINGSMGRQAIRKRGEPSVARVASRPIDVPREKGLNDRRSGKPLLSQKAPGAGIERPDIL